MGTWVTLQDSKIKGSTYYQNEYLQLNKKISTFG